MKTPKTIVAVVAACAVAATFAVRATANDDANGGQIRITTELDATLQTLIPELSSAERAELLEEEMIQAYTEDSGIQFRLMPQSTMSADVRRGFRSIDPNVVNEVLFLLPRPDVPDDELMLFLSNKLRAISELSGVTYISGRANEPRVLFDDVYRIASLDNKRRLPDPLAQTLVPEEDIHLHLEDSNFGRSYFRATYLAAPDAVAMGMSNAESLTYIFPVIGPERLRFQLFAMPVDDYLLLYGVVGVEISGFLRRMIDIESSFRRRIDALGGWFIDQVYE